MERPTTRESYRRTAVALRTRFDELVEATVDASLARVPEHGRVAGDGFRRAYRTAVEQALNGFLDILEGRTARAGWREAYRTIGVDEFRQGRSLEALQAGIRVATRVGHRELASFAEAESLPIVAMSEVADAMLAYAEELIEAATEGYAQAQATADGELDRRRGRLLDMLVADQPVAEDTIGAAASAARWSLPRRIAVVAVGPGPPDAAPPVLPPDVLADWTGPEGVLVVPDPVSRGQVRMLVNTLRGYQAAVGPAVPPRLAGNSMRWARRALLLAGRGIIDGTELVWCDDHLALLLIFQDEALLSSFIERRLRPLRAVRDGQRDLLADTFLSWLQNNMNASAVATVLCVHPQTVRRRLRQLHQLFGDRMRDPAPRFELEVALWAERARRGRAGSNGRALPHAPLTEH